MSNAEASLEVRVCTMQIIAGALIVGCLTAVIVACYAVQTGLAEGPGQRGEELPIVSLIGLGYLLLLVPVAWLVSVNVVSNGLTQLAASEPDAHVQSRSVFTPGGPVSDKTYLLMLRQTSLVIGLALFEGAALFGAIAYFIEGHFLGLVVAVVATIALIAQFPTTDRVRLWLEEQTRNLRERRAKKRS